MTDTRRSPDDPVRWSRPGTKKATSPGDRGSGAPGAAGGFTMSTMVTEIVFFEPPPRATGNRAEEMTKSAYTSVSVATAAPPADAESGRSARLVVYVTVFVSPGPIVTTSLCGINHGASEMAMPCSVPVPLFVKVTEPLGFSFAGAAISVRATAVVGATVPVGAAAMKRRIGIVRPAGTPAPAGSDAPSNLPGVCVVVVMVTICVAPAARGNDAGDWVKKSP